MTTNNLPQMPTSTGLSRTSAFPLSRARRLERSAERRVQDLAAEAYVEGTAIALNMQNALARVDRDTAVGEARVHGATVIQHTETMGLADYGDIVDARIAQAGPVARQLITESLSQASRRVNAVTDSAIRNL